MSAQPLALRAAAVVLLFAGIAPGIAHGVTPASVTRFAFAAGYYEPNGVGTGPGSSNYFVGNLGSEHRCYFVFNLSGIGPIVQDASLSVFTPTDGVFAPSGSFLVDLFDVSSSPTDVANGVDNVSIFNDLGTGNIFGSRVYTEADENHFATIPLNAAAVAQINSSLGQSFAIGGAVVPAPQSGEHTFGFSFLGDPPSNVFLTLTVVPEPAAGAIVFLAALAARRRFRAAKRNPYNRK